MVGAQSDVLSHHLSGGTGKNYETHQLRMFMSWVPFWAGHP